MDNQQQPKLQIENIYSPTWEECLKLEISLKFRMQFQINYFIYFVFYSFLFLPLFFPNLVKVVPRLTLFVSDF